MSLGRIAFVITSVSMLALTTGPGCAATGSGGTGGNPYPPYGGSGGSGGTGGTGGTTSMGGSGGGGTGGSDTGGTGGTGGSGGTGGTGGTGGGVFDLHVTGADLSTIGGTPTGLAEAWVAVVNAQTGIRENLSSKPIENGAFDVTLPASLGVGASYQVEVLVDLTRGQGICDRGQDFLFSQAIGPIGGDVHLTVRGTDTVASEDQCLQAYPPPPPLRGLQVEGSGFPHELHAVEAKLVNVSAGGTVVATKATSVDGAGTFHITFATALGRSANYDVLVWIDEDDSGGCDASDQATEVRSQALNWPDHSCAVKDDCDAGLACVKVAPEDPEGICGPLADPIVMRFDAGSVGRAGCDRFVP